MTIMRDAGIEVCESPSTLGKAMKEMLAGRKPRAREASRPAPKSPSRPAAKASAKGGKTAKAAGRRAGAKRSSKR